jgi:hypothetical protein
MPVASEVVTDVNEGVTADVEPAVAAAAGLRLVGYSFRESDGTPAVAAFNIVHGATVAAGTISIPVEMAANASDFKWFADGGGIPMESGITIEHVAGTFDLYLYYIP